MRSRMLSESTVDLLDLREFDEGRRIREARQRRLEAKTVQYVGVIREAMEGNRRALLWLQEAITTDDFPSVFGNVLDIAVYERFTAWVPPFERFVRVGDFTDLTRTKLRRQWRGGGDELGEVGELGPYPERGPSKVDFTWAGKKYGSDYSISWESMLADSLRELQDFPNVLAAAARYSEGLFVTRLYVGASGPNSSLYSVGQGNLGTAKLDITALSAALTAMAVMRDPSNANIPIFNRPRYLVVPPALEIVARQIVNSTMVSYAATAGTAIPLPTINPISQFGIEVIVDPNIPIVASSANGNTSWFLFADPNAGPLGPGMAALEFDRLRGMTAPLLLQKRGEFMSIGGGNDPRGELDSRDAATYRVVHAFGGARLFYQATYASDGSA